VQKLDIQGATVENRRDRRYGALIEQRDIRDAGTTVPQIIRHIPGSAGTLATRCGPTSNCVFEFGDRRGSRFFVNLAGQFIQEIEYEPFGEATSIGASVGTRDYSSYQWNDGDAVAEFGLVHLGARLYDPAIGRFISRDPTLVSRDIGGSNPYAFARNDPVNFADPTGLQEGPESHEGAVFEKEESPWLTFNTLLGINVGYAELDIVKPLLEYNEYRGFLSERNARAVGRLKWVGLANDVIEITDGLIRVRRDPSGENQARLLALDVGFVAEHFARGKLKPYGWAISSGIKLGLILWDAQQEEQERMDYKIRELKYPIHVEIQKRLREDIPNSLREAIKQVELALDLYHRQPLVYDLILPGLESHLQAERSALYRDLYWGGAVPERDISVPPELTLLRTQMELPRQQAKSAADVWWGHVYIDPATGLPLPLPQPGETGNEHFP